MRKDLVGHTKNALQEDKYYYYFNTLLCHSLTDTKEAESLH